MKLGIACVYFYGPDGDWILDLQLRYIANTLRRYDYKIYAAANRLQPPLLHALQSAPNVEIVPLPNFAGEDSAEHAYYLDRLLRRAASDNCTHIAALDSDSFPIISDWPDILIERMGDDIRLAAVLRSENGDTLLPHPCGYFMERSFLLDHNPTLLPLESEIRDAPFQEFLRASGQRVDTGIGFAYALWKTNERWLQLTRSNRWNPHFLMAGIYGDIFFHLGAGSRQPRFYQDYLTRRSLRIAAALRRVPLIWRLGNLLEERYIVENARAFLQITASLKNDPEQFLFRLLRSVE